MAPKTERMTHLEFIQKAFDTLRKTDKAGNQYAGLHTVYSGFNEAFRKYFPKDDPIKGTARLKESGEIKTRPCQGGAMIYMGEFTPEDGGDKALKAMGLG